MSIDRNRGTLERTNRDGITVIEFHDDPGAYFDRSGNPVPDETAESAGFDVTSGKIERRKRELIADATAKAEAEAREALQAAGRQAEAEVRGETAEPAEPCETETPDGAGPKIRRVGRTWVVESADGEILAEGLKKPEAEDLVAQLTGG